MDNPIRIEMFGGLHLHAGARVITRFRTHKTAALLAYMAYYCRKSHPRELLIDIFWPEFDMTAGRNYLSKALSSLRRQLEPPGITTGAVLIADRFNIQLNPEAIISDVMEFMNSLDAANGAKEENSRGDLLHKAIGIYSDELLPGYYEDWVLTERERLFNLFYQTALNLSQLSMNSGDYNAALSAMRHAVNIDPLREEGQKALIRLLAAAAGQRTAALKQYQKCEILLMTELGDTPGPEMRALAKVLIEDPHACEPASQGRSFQIDTPTSDDTAAFIAHASRTEESAAEEKEPQTRYMPRLPMQFTRFFGREMEIAHIVEMLKMEVDTCGARLITLTGTGGTGKTRLAVETARRVVSTFDGAVLFVPLADLRDPRQILEAILDSLGCSRSSDRDSLELLVEKLSCRPYLLLLDNFEHLLAAERRKSEDGASILQALRERVPSLTCLLTSRQPVHLEGEQEFPIPPLPIPVETDTAEQLTMCASVQLFIDRGQAIRPDFQVTARNAPDVASLCALLEGIPLALELAAARIQLFTPGQMLDQMNKRFDFLVSRRRDASERHRTLRAAIDWSYHLLTSAERILFQCLGVFVGGWTLEAATAVYGERDIQDWDALDSLQSLVEKSLVLRDEHLGEVRFRFLETIREYAFERYMTNEEREEIKNRHLEYYLVIAEEAEPHLHAVGQAIWLDRLDREHENLKAALEWCLETEQKVVYGLRLADALSLFWYTRGHGVEGTVWLRKLLSQGREIPTELRARVLYRAAWLAANVGGEEIASAREMAEESLAIAIAVNDSHTVARSYGILGMLALEQGDTESAQSVIEKGLPLSREIGDTVAIMQCLVDVGWLAVIKQDYDRAASAYEESLSLAQQSEDTLEVARMLYYVAGIAILRGDIMSALAYAERGRANGQKVGAIVDVAHSGEMLGRALAARGDFPAARRVFIESLSILSKTGTRICIAHNMECFANLAQAQGNPQKAVRVLAASDAILTIFNLSLLPVERALFNHTYAEVRDTLGEPAFSQGWKAGHTMSMDEAIEYALEES